MPKALVTRSAILAALALSAACTVHQTEIPSLTGPSEFALSLALSATPDRITRDGASQSSISVVARDANGQPLSGVAVRMDMLVDGQLVDFGTLSARTIVTGTDGRALVVYTAPAAPPPTANTVSETVSIRAIPILTNAQTSVTRTVDIRLMPAGVILPPADTPTPAFTFSPSPVNSNVPAIFDASTSCGGAVTGGVCNGSSAITSYSWNFGDGSPAASSMVVTHTFTAVATFNVTLTITNGRGLSASTTQTVAVTASAVPTASFVFSPSSPVVNQGVVFNADAARAAPGHTIVEYTWIFGDGTPNNSSGFLVTHAFVTAGTYNVTLTVKDETGAEATVSNAVTVGTGNPTAKLTLIKAGGLVITADGSASTAVGSATITTYTFAWGDGTSNTTGAASVVGHTYGVAGTFTVTLTVTDNFVPPRTGTVTASVTVP